MSQLSLEHAYPGLSFRTQTRNWWARLTRVPAECVHLETDHAWMALYSPDTVYFQGKPAARMMAARPEVSLCRACFLGVSEPEIAAYKGRVVAFEPDPETFSQYFFVAESDFAAAGLQPEVADAISRRLAAPRAACEACDQPGTWLWVSRAEVTSLDDFGLIGSARGRPFCPRHGAETLCRHFESIAEANLFYFNLPYGEAGAYVWI